MQNAECRTQDKVKKMISRSAVGLKASLQGMGKGKSETKS